MTQCDCGGISGASCRGTPSAAAVTARTKDRSRGRFRVQGEGGRFLGLGSLGFRAGSVFWV